MSLKAMQMRFDSFVSTTELECKNDLNDVSSGFFNSQKVHDDKVFL